MSLSEQDRVARGRFFALGMIRLSGIVILGLGVLIWRGDLLREGGWAAVGIPIALLGFLESLLLPKFFARRWRSPTDP